MNRSGKPSSTGEWKTPKAKIGLMYASDYQMSLGSSALSYAGASSSSRLKTGWMFSDDIPWTISRFGYWNIYSTYFAYAVHSSGSVSNYQVTDAYAVRPVFYLNSDIAINGTGTASDPYMIVN